MIEIDLETVRRAQQNDSSAARTIVEALHRPVIATIYRFLGAKWRAEVEDIAQDVFLKVFRALRSFDPERGVKFTTWVYTFVRNHCFDMLKRRRIPTTPTVADGETPLELVDKTQPAPPGHAETRELGEKIEQALQALGADQRLTFVLREYEGLDYGEIAAVMRCSEGTVKSRLHRAKESLRHRLEPYLRAGA